MNKTIIKSYPRKGVEVWLEENYYKDSFPRRHWKLWVKFKDNSSLEVHGILTNKTEAIDFYLLVCRSFRRK